MPNGNVLVCVCGGIAAYKTCEVVSGLVKFDFRVTVAMTQEATRFVGPLTFQALTARPVHTSLWSDSAPETVPHVELGRQADLVLVAPATANTLAKLAAGLADDLVSTILLAAPPEKVLLAPAMNSGMWAHPATVRNLAWLQSIGVAVFGPGTGWQACRTVGEGRMSEPAEIIQEVRARMPAPEPARKRAAAPGGGRP